VNSIGNNFYEPFIKMEMLTLQFIAAPEDDPFEVETCSACYINK
jgi:hypothetical protein